jgi:hypothetical protein
VFRLAKGNNRFHNTQLRGPLDRLIIQDQLNRNRFSCLTGDEARAQ